MSQGKKEQFNLSMRDVAQMLFRRKWTILFLYALILIFCGGYAFFWPPSYTATAKILVKNDRQESVISAERDVVKTLSKTGVTENDLNTEIELLTSYEVLKKTVLQLNLDKAAPHWLIRLINYPVNLFWSIYNSYHSRQNPGAVDLTVKRLKKKLEVMAQKKSDIIEVRLHAATREHAVLILDTLVSIYLEHQLNIRKTPDTQSFFSAQIQGQQDVIDALDRQISNVAGGADIDAVVLARNIKIETIGKFEKDLLEINASISEYHGKILELANQIEQLPKIVLKSTTESINQYAVGEARVALLELERERESLIRKYPPGHRLVKINDEQIKSTKWALDTEIKNPGKEKTMMLNSVIETLEQTLTIAKSELVAIQGHSKTLAEQINHLKKEASKLNKKIKEIETLTREYKVAEDNYLTYKKQFEEGRIESAMNQINFVDVSLTSRIDASPRPTKPRLFRLAMLAVFFGAFVSIGYGFLMEALDHTIKNKRDVSLYLDQPVIGAFAIDQSNVVAVPKFWMISPQARLRFRELMHRINGQEKKYQRLFVCSINPGEGASWVSGKLACAFSAEGLPVRLYSSDLLNECEKQEASGICQIEKPQGWADFAIEPDFQVTPEKQGDCVSIIDCPALKDSPLLRPSLSEDDAILLVIEPQRERREVIRQYIENLNAHGLTVLGIILNKQRQYVPDALYNIL